MSEYWTRAQRARWTRRRFLGTGGAAGAGVAGLALVGCGGDDDDDTTPDAGAATTAPGSNEGEGGQPRQGGILRFSQLTDPPSIYPYENISTAVQTPSSYHYSRLLRGAVGPDIGPTDYTKLEGDLSDGLPEQPDDLTYTFKLKPNILFHDKPPMNGRAATAQDFLATWDFFKGVAINASRFNQVVDRMEAPDDETIKITLKEPNAPFLVVGAASDQGLWFIPVETINNDQAKSDPVGTGPFVFRTWESGVRMAWDRHPNWYDGPRPYFDGLEVAKISDSQRILAALKAGELDYASAQPSQIEDLRAIEPQGTTTVLPNSSIVTFMFNFDNTPWNDKRVRQALSMALDRDGILEVVDPTGEQPWNSFFGPALVPYYMSPQDDAKWGDTAANFKHNPAEVKALLNAATGSDTLDVNVISSVDRYGPTAQQLWEVAVSSIKTSGFNAQNVFQEYGAYIQSSYFGKLPDPQAVTLGHVFGTVLDPDDLFMAAYWSKSSRHNWQGVPIPEMEELDPMFLKQRTLLDLEERTAYIQDIQRKMAESFLVIPVVNFPGVNFSQGWLRDVWHKQSYATIADTYTKAYFTEERIARG